ncbi:hypothetical protein F511_45190 [Dorcoceras hygrometricum]|uniref:Uncharacterized protein n=1 Tax=Dorcoceras hygrometricum TaxID=472368 RepID=A0A2Z6ZWR0_9LAMI|nr:hypothetical protein F511_45190 [Dorcoceras hygrometricum]
MAPLIARWHDWTRDWPRDDARGRAWLLHRHAFFVVAAADRPPLRRVSGDVVTAGLISSRVWFGPVPGSP